MIGYIVANKGYWCNLFGRLVWQIYIKLRPKSTWSINVKKCAEIATNPKYIEEISSVRYKLNADDMISIIDKDKAQAEGQAKMVSNYKALIRI